MSDNGKVNLLHVRYMDQRTVEIRMKVMYMHYKKKFFFIFHKSKSFSLPRTSECISIFEKAEKNFSLHSIHTVIGLHIL